MSNSPRDEVEGIIFTEPEANNCFSIISELKIRE